MRPLPEKQRPENIEHIIGQDHLLALSAPLRRMIETDSFHALLLWGPPGTGKTSLARVIAKESGSKLASLSAVSAGVKDIRGVIQNSELALSQGHKPHLLFMDEIHRLSKSQQDVLLPGLESGGIRFIGATTENPSFEVNNAILSRTLIFQLKPISHEDIVKILNRALNSEVAVKIADDVLQTIAASVQGDARKALNLLDALIHGSQNNGYITSDHLEPFKDQVLRLYDKSGESHYDIVSAFIKSIRASHPDAALHYLARMIDGGEKPEFIARRLLIAASEDIGNANPNALIMASSAMQAVHALGYPEARIVLSQVTTYLAASPKSNAAYKAIDEALSDIKAQARVEVPLHLRNAPTNFMKNMGYAQGYVYPHDEPESAKDLCYLPPTLKGRRYYKPKDIGVEKQLGQNIQQFRPRVD